MLNHRKWIATSTSKQSESETLLTQSINVYDQIIKLTKQNQYLHTRLKCQQEEILKLNENREKYKEKYRIAKNLLQIHGISRAMQKKQARKIGAIKTKNGHGDLEMRKSPSQIKQNENKMSPNGQFKQSMSNCEAPSTKSQLIINSMNKPKSFEEIYQNENEGKNWENQPDPYNINFELESKTDFTLQKINKGINSITELLEILTKCIEPLTGKNFNQIQKKLSKKIQEFGEHLEAFFKKIHPKQSKKISESQMFYLGLRPAEDFVKSHQFCLLQKSQSQSEEKMERSVLEISKKNEQQDPLFQETQMKIKKRKGDSRNKKMAQMQRFQTQNPYEDDNNESKFSNANNIGRFVESKSHRSMYGSNSAAYLEEKPKKMRNERMVSESSDRKSQWRLLKQIGKQLKNWKFCLQQSIQGDQSRPVDPGKLQRSKSEYKIQFNR